MTWNPVMMEGPNGQKKRLFEPVFNLGSIVLIVGLTSGGLGAFFNLKSDFAAQDARDRSVKELLDERATAVDGKLAGLSKAIEVINDLIISRSAQRYTKDDANHDFGIIDQRLDSDERRIERLEARPK